MVIISCRCFLYAMKYEKENTSFSNNILGAFIVLKLESNSTRQRRRRRGRRGSSALLVFYCPFFFCAAVTDVRFIEQNYSAQRDSRCIETHQAEENARHPVASPESLSRFLVVIIAPLSFFRSAVIQSLALSFPFL